MTPHDLANSIMGKFYDVLTNGDETVPKSADNFFSWCTPGIPVTTKDFEFLTQGFTGVVKPEAVKTMRDATAGGTGEDGKSQGLTPAQLDSLRAQDTSKLYMQAEALSRIVDFIPEVAKMNNEQFAKFAVMNDEGTLSEIYERTLKFSQVAQSQISDDEKKKIEHFRSLLDTTTEKTDLITGDKVQVSGPSPLVQIYHQKMAAYDDAALEYNSHRIDGLAGDDPKAVSYWAINAHILRDKVKAAMDDWITSGYKEQYEEIAAYIAQIEGRDLTLLKQEYVDDLDKAKLTGLASGSDFYYSALVPGDFAESAGWTGFTFGSSDVQRYANSSFHSSGWQQQAAGSFFGIFGGGESSSSSSAKQEFHNSFNTDSFSLSFEIAQIPIVRPWFKSSYLVSKTWRFDTGTPLFTKNDMLSDGGSPPKGFIPAYPTTIIFIRNLRLTLDKSSGFADYIAQQTSSSAGGGGVVAFGPSAWARAAATGHQTRLPRAMPATTGKARAWWFLGCKSPGSSATCCPRVPTRRRISKPGSRQPERPDGFTRAPRSDGEGETRI